MGFLVACNVRKAVISKDFMTTIYFQASMRRDIGVKWADDTVAVSISKLCNYFQKTQAFLNDDIGL